MKVALTFSSKTGLMQEYRQLNQSFKDTAPPDDFFAEGDSMDTIQTVMEAIRINGHSVIGIEADNAAFEQLNKEKPDLVFNMAEGLSGDFRESYIPMICERLGLPYTGSDPLTLSLCLNKQRCKEILRYHQIPSPAFHVYHPDEAVVTDHLLFPSIVKPIAEGSSKGIDNRSVVNDAAETKNLILEKFQTYYQPVIVEQFLTGSEFTVALWGNMDDVEVLPIVAINFEDLPEGAWPMYSYEAKWIWDVPENPLQIFQCPAPIDSRLEQEIVALTKRTYQILSIRDWCRMDIRLDNADIPHILEINPLPGILPKPEDNSCFPKAARTAGYNYSDMIGKLIEITSNRTKVQVRRHATAHSL